MTVALLPLWVLYGFSDAICFLVHRVLKYRVKVVRKNLRNSFPEKDEAELLKIERKFYHNLCDIIVETVKLLHMSDRQVYRRVRVENGELVGEITKSGRPFIMFLGHFGNWEWVQSMTIMREDIEVMGALYRPLMDEVMDRVMLRVRARFRLECIRSRNAYRRLLEIRRKTPSFGVGFIGDQRPLGDNLKHWTIFMNQPTAFVTGGETIGDRVDAVFIYAEMERLKRGYYSLNLKPMTPDPDDKGEFPYTRLFLRMLEESIRRQPANWLWSHNRWKAKPPLDVLEHLGLPASGPQVSQARQS